MKREECHGFPTSHWCFEILCEVDDEKPVEAAVPRAVALFVGQRATVRKCFFLRRAIGQKMVGFNGEIISLTVDFPMPR